MSSFYLREKEPQNGDVAFHTIYGYVCLIGKIEVKDNYGETFWLTEVLHGNGGYEIIKESDLENVGYYGD